MGEAAVEGAIAQREPGTNVAQTHHGLLAQPQDLLLSPGTLQSPFPQPPGLFSLKPVTDPGR